MIFVYDDWSFNSRLRKKFSQHLSNALSEIAQAKDVFEFVESNLMPEIFHKLYEKSEKLETVKIRFGDSMEVYTDVTCGKDGAVIKIHDDELFFSFRKYSYESEVAKLKCFLLKNIFGELNGCDKFSGVLNSLKMFEILQDNVTYSLFLFNCFNTFSSKYPDIQSISGIKDIEEFLAFEDFIDNPNDYYDKKDVKEFIALYKDCFGVECDSEFISKMIGDVKNSIV